MNYLLKHNPTGLYYKQYGTNLDTYGQLFFNEPPKVASLEFIPINVSTRSKLFTSISNFIDLKPKTKTVRTYLAPRSEFTLIET